MSVSDIYVHPASRPWLQWSIPGIPGDATLQVTFDLGVAWHDLERVPDTDIFQLLVHGPDGPTDIPTSVAISGVGLTVEIRIIDNPEVLIEPAGKVHVTRR